MPYCYGTGGGYGRYLERREQPIGLEPKKDVPPKERPVVCKETGEVFDSAQKAEYLLTSRPGATGASILRCCNGKSSQACRMHWRFATAEETRQRKAGQA